MAAAPQGWERYVEPARGFLESSACYIAPPFIPFFVLPAAVKTLCNAPDQISYTLHYSNAEKIAIRCARALSGEASGCALYLGAVGSVAAALTYWRTKSVAKASLATLGAQYVCLSMSLYDLFPFTKVPTTVPALVHALLFTAIPYGVALYNFRSERIGDKIALSALITTGAIAAAIFAQESLQLINVY